MTRKADLAAEVWTELAACLELRQEALRAAGTEHGLTPTEMRALLSLAPSEHQSMRALAQACTCDPSQATWLANRLEDRGLVRRRVSPSDRRVKEVVLTPQGREMRAAIRAAVDTPPAALVRLPLADLEGLRSALRAVTGVAAVRSA